MNTPFFRSLVSLLVIAAACTVAAGQAAAQKVTSINVTAVVHDGDTTGSPLLLRSDHQNGYQEATYTNTGKVTSVIFISGGAWQLYLGNQSLRTVWLTLASQGAPVPDGYYSSSVEVSSRCWDADNNETGLLQIAPGTSNNHCSLNVDFSNGRTKYLLAMNAPTFPGTGLATVSCNTPTGSTCNSWTIVPNSLAGNATVANLYQFMNNGSLVYIGTYHNTYRIDVTSP